MRIVLELIILTFSNQGGLNKKEIKLYFQILLTLFSYLMDSIYSSNDS